MSAGKGNGNGGGWTLVKWLVSFFSEATHDVLMRGCVATPLFILALGGGYYLAVNLTLPHTACSARIGCVTIGGWWDTALQVGLFAVLLFVAWLGSLAWRAGTFADNAQKVAAYTGSTSSPAVDTSNRAPMIETTAIVAAKPVESEPSHEEGHFTVESDKDDGKPDEPPRGAVIDV